MQEYQRSPESRKNRRKNGEEQGEIKRDKSLVEAAKDLSGYSFRFRKAKSRSKSPQVTIRANYQPQDDRYKRKYFRHKNGFKVHKLEESPTPTKHKTPFQELDAINRPNKQLDYRGRPINAYSFSEKKSKKSPKMQPRFVDPSSARKGTRTLRKFRKQPSIIDEVTLDEIASYYIQ